ncbi:MAG: DUF202 domain-containing protein [Frankia sp.]|nr:DUF202 domain-containing protein [Frankia sp.]
MEPELPPPPDSGLQSERTYLAWLRTALSFAGLGALLLHSALSDRPALLAPGILGMATGAALAVIARQRYRMVVGAVIVGRSPVDHRLVAAASAAATAVGLSALVVFLIG